MRIVLDTNVLVSAIIHNGKPRKLFQMGIDCKYQIITSKEILDELLEVIKRPKFKMTRGNIVRIVSTLMETGKNVQITSSFRIISDDLDDNIIINTAHDGNADYVVSGDRHLLDLIEFRGIKIVTVSKMFDVLH